VPVARPDTVTPRKAKTPPPYARLKGRRAIQAKILLRVLILRRQRAMCSLSTTQVTFPAAPIFFL
jgi:hypothetical protein